MSAVTNLYFYLLTIIDETVFSFLTLFEKNPKLGEEILEDSINLLEQCDKNLISAQRILKQNHKDETIKLRVKKAVHTRITGIYYNSYVLIVIF